MIKKRKDIKSVEHMFSNSKETMVLSCLQGVMGEIYVDNQKEPTSAMATLGDFIFFAGVPNKELVLYKPKCCKKDFIIMVPQNKQWEELIEQCYKSKSKRVSRYATKKEINIFETEKLQHIISMLPKEYEIKPIDENIYYRCKQTDWCKDFVSQYADYKIYCDYGLGFVILKDDKIVSGASSYSSYKDGIEIEIHTHEKHRRRGLAYICGAKLILECLERKLYPSWDAQNKWSLALAEKLGYNYSHTYDAYEIIEY